MWDKETLSTVAKFKITTEWEQQGGSMSKQLKNGSVSNWEALCLKGRFLIVFIFLGGGKQTSNFTAESKTY